MRTLCFRGLLGLSALWLTNGSPPELAAQAPNLRTPRNPQVSGADWEVLPSAENQAGKPAADRFVTRLPEPTEFLDVEEGQPTILELAEPPIRIHLPDEETVKFEILDEKEGRILSLVGLKPGATTLTLWFTDPTAARGVTVVSYRVRVMDDPEQTRRYERKLSSLQDDLNRSFPNSVISLSYVGGEVLVRGKAKDVAEATQILRVVSRSLPEDANDTDLSQLETQLEADMVAEASAMQRTDAFLMPGLPLAGPAFFDPDRIERAGGLSGIAQGRTITGANAANINNRVVNLLEISGVHQVQLKVTLAEVVRDAGRSLVADLGIGDSFVRPGSASVDFTAIEGVGQFTLSSNRFFLQVDALKRLGLARSLAEPNLTSLNGQPATFLVGGQFPILESSSTVAAVIQNIRFIPFGVQLMVTPTVTDGDRIRLNLFATVSEQAGVGIGGGGGGGGGGAGGIQQNDPAQPPSLSTRAFTTTVELRSSESLAIAGLIRNSLVNNSVRVPYLGDIPVLGSLFSNNSTSYQEQELIIVVTPQLVSPIPAEERPPLPGSDSFEPSDCEFFLEGSLEGRIAEDYRSPIRGDLEKMRAFRQAEQRLIIGRPGHTSGQALPGPRASKIKLTEDRRDPVQ